MKKLIFSVFVSCLLLAGCKSDGDNKSNSKKATGLVAQLAGNWVTLGVCQTIGEYGSVIEATNNTHVPFSYALAFDVNTPDQVVCYNGVKSWQLPINVVKDTIEMVGAKDGKSIFLVVENGGQDKVMTMFDGTTDPAQMDVFTKSNAMNTPPSEAFKLALNYNLLGQNYTSISKSNAKPEVMFYPNGIIKGIDPYNHYEICAGGDCFLGGGAFDVIELSNTSDASKPLKNFGFKFSTTNDTLTLYNLENTTNLEKGLHKTIGAAYVLAKKKAPAKEASKK